jgi:hypothetical protein
MKEVKIEDIIGKFISPLTSDGKMFRDARWVAGRLILSNKNIWLIGKDRKRKIPLSHIFDIGGGIPKKRKFKAVQLGGPSGGCVPEEYIDTPVDYESIAKVGAMAPS